MERSRDYSPRGRSMSISPEYKGSPDYRSRSPSRSPHYKRHNGHRSPTFHSSKKSCKFLGISRVSAETTDSSLALITSEFRQALCARHRDTLWPLTSGVLNSVADYRKSRIVSVYCSKTLSFTHDNVITTFGICTYVLIAYYFCLESNWLSSCVDNNEYHHNVIKACCGIPTTFQK